MKRAILAALIVLSIIAGVLYAKSERITLGAEAHLYGYPLVMMDVTRANAALAIGPENQLHRVRRFPDAGFHDVVRPNVDTLYTTAFIDMAKGMIGLGANLPVRAGEPFLLNGRLYWPKPPALNGAWGMPAVERID